MAGMADLPFNIRVGVEDDGSAKARFLSAIDSFGDGAKRSFERSFGEINKIIDTSLSGFKGGKFGFSVDIPGLKQAAADADFAQQRLAALQTAASQLARTTGDTSQETQRYLQALSAQVVEAQRAKQTADAQVTTYERLQGQIAKVANENGRLAESYRATFLEQARAENAAYRSQQAFNSIAAPGLANRATSNGAGFGALAELARSQDQAAQAAVEFDRLRLAEASAAEGARLLAAAHAGTALEIGRVTNSARESASAFEAMFAAQTKLASAADQLRAELDPALAVQQRFDAEMQRADDLLNAGAISAREYAAAQALARTNIQAAWQELTRSNQVQAQTTALARRGTTESTNVINGLRAQRAAYGQLGQQLQDVVVQAQFGTSAITIFTQQVPQMAFALSGLAESTNKTQQRIGLLATALSGPGGAAFFGAVAIAGAVIGPLISKLLGFGDAADDAKGKTYDFSKSLDFLTISANAGVTAMQQLVQETRNAISVQGDFAEVRRATAEGSVKDLESRIAAAQKELKGIADLRPSGLAGLLPFSQPSSFYTGREAKLQAQIKADQQSLIGARQAALNAEIAASQTRVNEELDAGTAAAGRYNREVGALIRRREQTIADPIAAQNAGVFITASQFEAEFRRLTKLKKAAEEATRGSRGGSSQFGREVSVSQARSIAEQAGFRVTSGLRTRAEQQRLYDTVRTPQNPVARPGTSAHERGNALDIAFGAGVTPASIKKAFAEEGVRLTKILKETGHFHVEFSTAGADKAERESEQVAKAAERARAAAEKAAAELQQFGERSAEAVQRVNERFNEQPRLIDQAAQATRQLDALIADLGQRKPPGFEQIIKDAQTAKGVIQDALVRPFQDLARESERRVQIERLLVSGREDEASALQTIWQLEERLGPLTAARKDEVLAIARGEREQIEALERIRENTDAYLSATRSVRQEVEAILSGQGKFSNFKQIFRNLQGRILTEQLFGPIFRDLEKNIRQNTGIDAAVDKMASETTRAGEAASNFADVLNGAANRVAAGAGGSGGPAAGINGGIGGALAFLGGLVAPTAHGGRQRIKPFGIDFGSPAANTANDNGGGLGPNGEIVVVAPPKRDTVGGMTPTSYTDILFNSVTKHVLGGLDNLIPGLSGVLGRAVSGFATGGVPGGVIGLLKGTVFEYGPDVFGKGITDAVLKGLDKAGAGAATGTAAAGIMKMLGIKTSTTGAQIGGAIGGLTGIPGGDIIGSILGGLVGGLFKKTKKASASIAVGADGFEVGSVVGNSSSRKEAASGLAGNVSQALNNIAAQLGGTATGPVGVSIGIRKKSFRVDTTGSGRTKKGANVVDFGEDQEAATKFAIANAIADGAIQGLRAGTQRLIQAGKDVEAQLQKALDFESIFTRLKAHKDPVGAALDTLDKEFSRLRTIAIEAGEGLVETEQLYGIERAKVVKDALEAATGSIKSLLDDLTVGSETRSLRERAAFAQAAFDPLRARVAAGDITANDDFAAAARTLLDIQRQINGSQGDYFAIEDQIRALSQGVLDKQTAIANATTGRDSPFSTAANDNVVSAIDNQTNQLLAAAVANNNELAAIKAALGAGGGLPFNFSTFF